MHESSCEGRLCIPPARGVLPGFSAQTIALEPITPSSSLLCEEDSLVVILLLLQSSPCKSLPPKQFPATTTCLAAVSILPTVRPLGAPAPQKCSGSPIPAYGLDGGAGAQGAMGGSVWGNPRDAAGLSRQDLQGIRSGPSLSQVRRGGLRGSRLGRTFTNSGTPSVKKGSFKAVPSGTIFPRLLNRGAIIKTLQG